MKTFLELFITVCVVIAGIFALKVNEFLGYLFWFAAAAAAGVAGHIYYGNNNESKQENNFNDYDSV